MSQPDEATSVQQFFSWANREGKTSRIHSDNDERILFNPIPPIKAYFKDENHEKLNAILAALFESDAPPGIAEVIVKDYVAVFSILIYIGKGRHIQNFVEYSLDDQHLPFGPSHPPPDFPNSSDEKFFEKFCNQQWRFCCPILSRDRLYNRHFHEKQVLPIADKQQIGAGGSAMLYKIKIYDEHNDLYPANIKGELSPEYANTFVLKTYVSKDAEKDSANEVAAFQRLKGHETLKDAPYIIGYYGSFVHGKTRHILLEYADKGDLERYFMEVVPPDNGDSIISFWEGMLNVTRALMDIHTTKSQSTPDAPVFQGLHQDVKPQNILIISKGVELPCKWQFKLGDFGLSQFKKLKSLQAGVIIDAQGTRTYGAPECYRDEIFAAVQLEVTPKADIWSLGCIYSEAARWIATGTTGLLAYRRDRLSETQKIPNFGDGSCFHNGEQILQTVHKSHKATVQGLHREDTITQRVLERFVNKMLESDPDKRPTAKQLFSKVSVILADARDELSNLIGKPTTSPSVTSQVTPRPPPPPVLPDFFHPPALYGPSKDNFGNQHTVRPSLSRRGDIRSSSVNQNVPTADSSARRESLGNLMTSALTTPSRYTTADHASLEGALRNLKTDSRSREENLQPRDQNQNDFSEEPGARRRSTLPAEEPKEEVAAPLSSTGLFGLPVARSNDKIRDRKDSADSSQSKKSQLKSRPLYCFSADGRNLFLWARDAEKIVIYNVICETSNEFDAVDIHLAAGGENVYATVSKTGNQEHLHIYQVSDGTLVNSVPLNNPISSVALSRNDKFVALGCVGKALVYNIRQLSDPWTHLLPPTEDRESKCERVWFSADSNKLIAAMRNKEGNVYTYVSDCHTPTTNYNIPSIPNPQGHYQDFGVSSVLYNNKLGYACVTAYASKMAPTFFSLQDTPRLCSLNTEDLRILGNEIQCATSHPDPNELKFFLANSENNIFSVHLHSKDRWKLEKICKLRLDETCSRNEMMVIGMPNKDTIYAFRLQRKKKILSTIIVRNVKSKVSVSNHSRDISAKLRI